MAARRFDLVLLDCDGVLVDSERTTSRIFAAAVGRLGVALTPEEALERFVGGETDGRRWLEEALAGPIPAGFVESLRAETHAAFGRELLPVAGVAAALDAIEAAGIATAVASGGSREKIELTLGRTGLRGRFAERIFSSYEVGAFKPDPGLFLHAARVLGAAPTRCAVVEDSPNGVRAAVAAGMAVFGYAEVTDGAKLARLGARVFRDMADLPALLGAARLSAGGRLGSQSSPAAPVPPGGRGAERRRRIEP